MPRWVRGSRRSRRGSVSRPTTEEIYRYRQSVDRRVEALIEAVDEHRLADLEFVVRIGIEHEQQHQELFYTEIKCILAGNPPNLRQPYPQGRTGPCDRKRPASPAL